jgi:hypothetical protein
MAIVICVLEGSGACGIELPVTDTGLMALLKATLKPALVPIFAAPFGGATVKIVGAAVSAAVPAVKL